MLWNFKPQLRAFRFLGHRAAVNHVEFAPSGQFIASGNAFVFSSLPFFGIAV
jgi:centriolar protein POC1